MKGKTFQNPPHFFLHISRGLDQTRGLYSLAVLPSQHSHCEGRQLNGVTEAQIWHSYEKQFFCSLPLARTSHMDERGPTEGTGKLSEHGYSERSIS